jgi:hypothetical protein
VFSDGASTKGIVGQRKKNEKRKKKVYVKNKKVIKKG